MKRTLILIAGLLLSAMASGQIQTINVGATANDHTGDPLRTALQKVNSNFNYVEANKANATNPIVIGIIKISNGTSVTDTLATKADSRAHCGSMTWPGTSGIPFYSGSQTWGVSIPNNSSNWDLGYDDRFKWDGGSMGLVPATGRISLGGTTVGIAYFTLTNPNAVRYSQVNADNSVSLLTAAAMKTALGVVDGFSEANVRSAISDSLNELRTNATPVADVAMLKHPNVSAKTSNYTLALADDGGVITMNVATANNLTVPPNSSVAFPLYTQITVHCLGAGVTTVVPGSGVTVTSKGDLLDISVKGDAYLIKLSTNTWKLVGSLE